MKARTSESPASGKDETKGKNGEYNSGKNETKGKNGEYNSGKNETKGKNGEYNSGKNETKGKNGEYNSGKNETKRKNGEYNSGKNETKGKNGEYNSGKNETKGKNGEYNSGKNETKGKNGEYNSGKNETKGKNGEYNSGKNETKGKNGEYNSGKNETKGKNDEYNSGKNETKGKNGEYNSGKNETNAKNGEYNYKKYHEQMVNSLRAESVEAFSRHFTKRPHVSGGEQNKKLGEYIRDKWLSYKFDHVEMVQYDVLLSMPPRNKPNVVTILNTTDNSSLWNVEGPEKIAEPSENDPLVLPPFLSYSPPGVVPAADLLYANYGTVKDFQELDKRNLNCTGKIVIMRYGKTLKLSPHFFVFQFWQKHKSEALITISADLFHIHFKPSDHIYSLYIGVQNAEACGAAGVLLYSDPADYSPEGMDNTFPKTWWLPGTGTQRGNIWMSDGDPLTPLLPSIDGVYRLTRNDTDVLPNIPAHVITYDYAVEFLKRLKGVQVPPQWAGGLNIVYRFGPGFKDSDLKVRLEVNNQFVTKPVFNVIGTITGKEEPDRLVLMGNHRDAVVFGGVDPSSGTAVMMEVSRGIGELLE
ncbi:hypothetical protein ACROYT_G006090 [Oculina patagonica]